MNATLRWKTGLWNHLVHLPTGNTDALRQTHTSPLINKTQSEAGSTFASCLCILQPSATILFLPPCTGRRPYLSPSFSLAFPLNISSLLFQPQSSALFSAHTPSNTHTCAYVRLHRHAKTFAPASASAYTAFLSCPLLLSPPFLSGVVPSRCEIHISSDTSQGVYKQDYTSALWN